MKLLTSICFALVIFSFTAFTSSGNEEVVGKYGVPGVKASITELTLNKDHTFRFRDDLGNGKKIDVQGIWEEKHNAITLKSNTPGKAFRDKWKITDNGMAAKSRKGLSFYRLARL